MASISRVKAENFKEMENTDNCKAWLEEQIETENIMFVRALREVLGRKR